MRIISKRTLKQFWQQYPQAEQPLKAWFDEAEMALWDNPNELKLYYRTASIITNKRVVFNIHGNDFRLVVDIECRLKIIFIVWIGTHGAYDKIDVTNVNYVKTHSNRTRIR
jgi:mRNA-degrading endonuclease HigB of HigAB toxin-antitoxin module